tara:strand:+ start:393 stop:917 length:525 start_codon:yes stop_codon:yes gene_type:complete
MKIKKTQFKDLLVFNGIKFVDTRGEFRELIIQKYLKKKLIFTVFSRSKKNVLRGLHIQKTNMQGKFITVLNGKILDVVVDCRKKSKTFGKVYQTILSSKNCKSIYIPPGFLHGFLGLDKDNMVVYGCTNYRHKESEIGVKWNDPTLKINWSIKKPILSKKDKQNILFKDFAFKK